MTPGNTCQGYEVSSANSADEELVDGIGDVIKFGTSGID